MSYRAYTVSEIEELRKACETYFMFGVYKIQPGGGGAWGRGHKEHERIVAVDAMVRTHMQAGHTADYLRSWDNPHLGGGVFRIGPEGIRQGASQEKENEG